ncbi:hypothetical protein [Maribacter sp. 4G9]|uniref:hypothetical protein n=1 Tax=Maribacter sp. 4G9 TaxID=1889777 RepID=UPI000C161A63|nr:hypothetical protein [Maribacter sp. 4G9]PIB38417.1 hypothetical protein BFP75_16040 [Maribacter sp. 4G9]
MKNFHKRYHGLKNYFYAILLLLVITACSDGEDGMDGPQGLQGEQGEVGEVGSTGTVAFFYSNWIPSEFANPLPFGVSGFNIESDLFISDLKDNGTILAYVQLTSGEIIPLPLEVPAAGQVYSYTVNDDDQLRVFVTRAEISSATPLIESVRYIIIPGTEQETGKAPAQDFSKMSYSEVAQHLGITD